LLPIFLLGIFISNADISLVLATHPLIASHFHALPSSSYLVTSYTLASCISQPITGALSSIYGRKPVLTASYLLFAVGCLLCGVAPTFWMVLLGRVVSGIGGAGMYVLVTVIITDLCPLREVATWRAYVNIAATMGRSLGGPLGGWLADWVGWRWSFAGQAPLVMVALVLSVLFIPEATAGVGKSGSDEEGGQEGEGRGEGEKKKSRLARVDFAGAGLLTLTVLALLVPLTVGGQKLPWTHPLIIASFVGCGVAGTLFYFTEQYWAVEPIFPLHLLRNRDVLTAYGAYAFQTSAQMGMMFTVPTYFQVTNRVSSTIAGVHLMPAFFGNVIGGLSAGFAIRKTGRYKILAILAFLSSSSAYIVMILRWHGHTSMWESLEIAPGGLGMAMAEQAIFVSLNAGVDPSYSAVAISGMLLSGSIGLLIGVSVNSIILTSTLYSQLTAALGGGRDNEKIVDRVVSDISFVMRLEGRLRDLVVGLYVRSLEYCHAFSFACAICAFFIAVLFLRERKL
ncbi:MFS general substrate transporter, partial [Aulographum hederae CBS 113979]